MKRRLRSLPGVILLERPTVPARYPTWGLSPKAAPYRTAGPWLERELGTGKGDDTISSGLEVTWTSTPTKWSNNFFRILFGTNGSSRKARPVHTSGNPKEMRALVPYRMRTTRKSAARRQCSLRIFPLRFDSRLRKDFAPFLRAPGPACRCFCKGMVQTHPP